MSERESTTRQAFVGAQGQRQWLGQHPRASGGFEKGRPGRDSFPRTYSTETLRRTLLKVGQECSEPNGS